MNGETNIGTLIASMSATLVEGLYVFATVPHDQQSLDIVPRMAFREAEGMTYILLKPEADSLDLEYDFPCRMITLNIHSSLEAVGFMARIATELAKHDMGVNPVSGYFHDHLFVPDGRQGDAIKVLDELSKVSSSD
ncbi:ACT domain-containing protein [uncultured Tateyamaria sp.]|uniref:ACT domain-containing protein n=1 Tax=uncultured Tateyamaria sp. TaxID=455651 RepID=UPI0026394C5B|nr:ACT domain-containing protein [uncultured Tateyamaria sp.]